MENFDLKKKKVENILDIVYHSEPDIGLIYICPDCHALKVERVMTNNIDETFDWYCYNCGKTLEYEPHLTIKEQND